MKTDSSYIVKFLRESYKEDHLPEGFGSLLKGCDPTWPERWQGYRPSLTTKNLKLALVRAWDEGSQFKRTESSLMARSYFLVDAERLLKTLRSTHPDAVPPLERRRILDCAFMCGLHGWSNIKKQVLGDGKTWKPMIRPGVRYKMSSKGTIHYEQ